MRTLGRVGSAIFGAIAGILLAAILTVVVWFAFFWESVPCGATTCDNDGDLLAPVILATIIGAALGAAISWRRSGQSPSEFAGSPSQSLR